MKLDRSLLSYSALVALASTSTFGLIGGSPSLAADRLVAPAVKSTVSGYVDLHGLFGTYRGGSGSLDNSENYAGFGGAGRLNWWFSPTWALQLDAYGQSKQNGYSYTTFGIAGHLALRDPRLYALGFMASTGAQAGVPWSTLALQAQYYLANLTLYGQAGATHAHNWNLGTDWYAFLQARYFANPNLALIADATFAKLSSSKMSGSTMWKLGLQAEYRPGASPLSLFARLQHARTSFSGGGASGTETTAYLGIKLYSAQPTLLSNDRDGATFLDANPVYGAFNTKFISGDID